MEDLACHIQYDLAYDTTSPVPEQSCLKKLNIVPFVLRIITGQLLHATFLQYGIPSSFHTFCIFLTGKHLCQSLRPATLFKKETLAQVFSCEFCEISKNIFYKEHLRITASITNSVSTRETKDQDEYYKTSACEKGVCCIGITSY